MEEKLGGNEAEGGWRRWSIAAGWTTGTVPRPVGPEQQITRLTMEEGEEAGADAA